MRQVGCISTPAVFLGDTFVIFVYEQLLLFASLPRTISKASAAFLTAQKRFVLYLGDICPLHSAGGSLLGLILDQPVLSTSQDLHWSVTDPVFVFYSALYISDDTVWGLLHTNPELKLLA